MRILLRFIAHSIWFVFLTLLTQIGGLVWLLSCAIAWRLQKKRPIRFLSVFVVLYWMATFVVVPPFARQFGRVPMPVFSNPTLRPESLWTRVFNRSYVRPELLAAVENVAAQLQKKHPGAVMLYMDCNFPFINGYPLTGHFSHKDGKKIDIALFWTDVKTGEPLLHLPSPIGYGVCAEPQAGEYDYNKICREKGYWYIDFDRMIAKPFFKKENYRFDAAKTREMVRLFAEHSAIGKILLEPHLKTRLTLEQYDKIRRQGCHAARHDDHIHVQL